IGPQEEVPDKSPVLDNPMDSCLPRFIFRHQSSEPCNSVVDLLTGDVLLKVKGDTTADQYLSSWYGLSPNAEFFVDAGRESLQRDRVREWIGSVLPRLVDLRESRPLVRLWDTSTGEELPALRNCKGKFLFAPDSGTLAVQGEDGSIQLWDLPPRKPLGFALAL